MTNFIDQAKLGARHGPILGVSPWAMFIREGIGRVAVHSSSTLITGPSGTGKELVARAIHALSPRAGKPFIPVDCAAVTGALFVSHIFGHVRGAFTGAHHSELGCFRAADGGTIFLDEIGELDLELQAKLLRVLQERTVIPVGSHEEIPVNVRVIAATNRDLWREVTENRFRGDLYYRLNVVALKTIALKDRPEDVPILASNFLAKLVVDHGLPLKELSNAALRRMRSYDWPGNVREMENILERAVLFTEGRIIGPDAIPEPVGDSRLATELHPLPPGAKAAAVCPGLSDTPSSAGTAFSNLFEDGRWPTMSELEREHILRTLERTNFNQSAAARLLDVERHQLMRKTQKYGIDASQSKRGRPPARRRPSDRPGE